jgi:peptidoglycan/LPS O-acetylase OafA/YrhL
MASADRDNNFDLVRLFAALQVAMWHAAEHLQLPIWAGYFPWTWMQFPGLAIFFGVSGFLVTRSFRTDHAIGPFFWRRALRIYPGLWACLIVIEVALFSTGAFPSHSLDPSLQAGWELLLFVSGSNSFADLFFPWPFNHGHFFLHFPSGVLWTITVELQFYLLVPFIVIAVMRAGRLAPLPLAALLVLSITVANRWQQLVAEHYYSRSFELIRLSIVPQLWMFLIGMAAELYWHKVRRLFEGTGLLWLAAYLGFGYLYYLRTGIIFTDYMNPTVGNVIKTAFLLATVFSLAHTFRRAARVLRGADLSYGIYLYHMPVVWTLLWLGYAHSLQLWYAVSIITFLFAATSWFIVERPMLRLKRLPLFAVRRMRFPAAEPPQASVGAALP